MNNVTLKTERTEMKFPLPFITAEMIVNAIGDKDTIEFMDAVPTMEYTENYGNLYRKTALTYLYLAVSLI